MEIRASVRASDADRERVVEQLREAAAEGRLDHEELDARAGAALRAATTNDLQALLGDLPPRPSPSRGHSRQRRPERIAWLALLGLSLLLIGIWALTGAGYFWPAWAIGGTALWLFKTSRHGLGTCGHARRRRHPATTV